MVRVTMFVDGAGGCMGDHTGGRVGVDEEEHVSGSPDFTSDLNIASPVTYLLM